MPQPPATSLALAPWRAIHRQVVGRYRWRWSGLEPLDFTLQPRDTLAQLGDFTRQPRPRRAPALPLLGASKAASPRSKPVQQQQELTDMDGQNGNEMTINNSRQVTTIVSIRAPTAGSQRVCYFEAGSSTDAVPVHPGSFCSAPMLPCCTHTRGSGRSATAFARR
jgi:hypothetical protein